MPRQLRLQLDALHRLATALIGGGALDALVPAISADLTKALGGATVAVGFPDELDAGCRHHADPAWLCAASRRAGAIGARICAQHPAPVPAPAWSADDRAFVVAVADVLALAQDRERSRRDQDVTSELRQLQKMDALGTLAGGVAHDFNNLLTPILMCGELLRDDLVSDANRRESVADIIAAALEARALVSQLLAFGRRQTLDLHQVDLDALCAQLVPIVALTLPAAISIEQVRTIRLTTVRADAARLQQVLHGLIANAREAMPGGGVVRLSTSEGGADGARYVAIVVEDTGVGIAPDALGRVFEPFYTTKPKARGIGLGLSTVYGIVRQHRGSLHVTSEVGRGARFEVRLPCSEPTSVPASPVPAVVPVVRTRGTVLVVEADPSVRSLVGRVLRREGFDVLAARDARTAITLCAAHAGPLALVLTDLELPEMDGAELYAAVTRERPGTHVLYTSRDPDRRRAGLLHKPFALDELMGAVRAVMG